MAAVTRQHTQRCLCLRTTIQYQVKSTLSIISLTVCLLYPSTHTLLIYEVLASCTTSVYVNLSKNSFFSANAKKMRESGCKGTTNFNTFQIFSQLFLQFYKSFRVY